MLSRARYILLNAYHILIDGLFDAVPILLAFMVISFGEGEKEVGLIVSVGTAAGTAAGLGTLLLSRKLGFMQTITLVTAVCGAGFCAATFSGNIVVAGLCFILAVAGYNVFHNIAFSYLTLHTERRRLGRVMSDFTAIGDVGRIPWFPWRPLPPRIHSGAFRAGGSSASHTGRRRSLPRSGSFFPAGANAPKQGRKPTEAEAFPRSVSSRTGKYSWPCLPAF